MDGIKVSVVIATYNGSKYIEEQLDSIRNQTLSPDEVIICDDRSSDDTVAVVNKYIKEHNLDGKWSISVNEKNLGYADNFDHVTMKAKGTLIFFSDQDDVWEKNKLEIMTSIMDKNPECVVLCSDYTPWYTSENAPQAPKNIVKRMPDNGILETIKIKKKSIYIGALGCCMCVRKDFYHDICDYRFDGWAQDDRMWKMAQCAHGCMILHRNLVKHRIHDNNTATYGKYHTVDRRVKLFSQMLDAEKQMLTYLTNSNADKKEIKIIKKHITMMEERIDLIGKRKIFKSIPLLGKISYYERIKSYPVELYMALKGK